MTDTTRGFRKLAENAAENKLATIAFRGSVGLLVAISVGLLGWILKAQYDQNGEVAGLRQLVVDSANNLADALKTLGAQKANSDSQMHDIQISVNGLQMSEAGQAQQMADQTDKLADITKRLDAEDLKIRDMWSDIAAIRASGRKP